MQSSKPDISILKSNVREIPDFPKKGVNFKDITPILSDKKMFRFIIDKLSYPYQNVKIDKVAGIDARGFLLASALAYKLKSGVAVIRKKGKLPRKTIKESYSLEYATNTLEIHKDAISENEKIILIDDVLATGGTMRSSINLVNRLGGNIVGISFLIEILNLYGRNKLKPFKVYSLLKYKS